MPSIFIYIFICLISLYIYISFKPDNITVSSYFPLFGLLYITTYYLTKKTNLSLFTGLLVVIGKTIYRYEAIDSDSINNLGIENTILFIFGISIPFFVSHYIKYFDSNYINVINFVGINYVLISCVEYILHKYVMHCNKESKFGEMIKKIPYIRNKVFDISHWHIQHHLDVGNDMHIDEETAFDLEQTIYMGWSITAQYVPIIIAILAISRNITNVNISNLNILVISFIISFIWQYIWNKVHAEMHNLENKYSIKKGPYDEGLFDLNQLTRVLLTNHTNHHKQKGEKKGNYNVILLGADEWFNSNNKTINNDEYCTTNINDNVCQ